MTKPLITTHHVGAPFNHVPHIVMDILFVGFWIPIHLYYWRRATKVRGHSVTR